MLATSVDKRFDAIDKQFDAIEKQFDAIEKRIDALDRRIDRVDTKARWIISTLVASFIAGGILGFNMLNYFFK